MLYGAKDIKGLKVITITNGPVNAADIRKMGDQLKDRFPNIVAVLAATAEDKAHHACRLRQERRCPRYQGR